ncbi:MAG TPA: trypsin-like peptidase domain-containing protein [Gemmatimonadaceae bacterium]|nr:trypsin-like peptidase domain-containing protein [Gemmatimonadaceae bacterium]
MASQLMRIGIVLVVLGAAACTGTPATSDAQVARTAESAKAANIPASRRTAITAAVARVAPSVVTVQTEMVQRVAADPFEAFFGGRSGTQTSAGLGTGFIIRPDGVIVTNAHVVAGATNISVMLRDGTTYPAKTIGTDETNDLAVLKVNAKDLPVAPLGDSDNLLVGEWAIAIGNPYGFMLGNPEPSVTAGVISGVGRNLVARGEGPSAYFDMIQTDASINPGNSGGPLVNADGEVIGVNSSIYSTSGGSIGLGFAIPIDRARRVAEDLLTHGRVRRPWIGVQLEPVTTQNPRDLIARGAQVASVAPSSPAEQAGIRPGDVIVRLRDRTIRNRFDWEAALLDLRVGDKVALTVRRGSRDLPVTVAIADLPEVSAPKVEVMRELQLVTLTPAIRSERGILSSRGALIYKASDRITQELGMQAGDVIVQINRTPITSAEDVSRALDYYAGRGVIRLFFERQGQIYPTDFVIR